MPRHKTETMKGDWDAGAMVKAMGDEPTEAQLRAMHAWVDPEGDPTAKSSYKMPHHVAMDGKVGAANMTACSSAMGALNGARGGMSMSESDRRGVHAHIAGHMQDAGMEAPEMKSARSQIERRTVSLVELRVDEGEAATAPMIRGHAAVFDSPSAPIMGMFVEKIAQGAFKRTLQQADIRALMNHDPNYVLGRNKAGTLRLREDDLGLAIENDPPNTTWARDLLESMKRGDVDQMSFGFQVVKEKWDRPTSEGLLPTRTLQEVKLFDVSVVTFPAYQGTEASVRSAEEIFATYLPEADSGQPLHSADDTSDSGQPLHSEEQPSSLAGYKTRLDRIEATL